MRVLILIVGLFSFALSSENLEDFLTKNNELVKSYLLGLKSVDSESIALKKVDSEVSLSGVKLTDERMFLKDHKLLSFAKIQGFYLYLFETPEGNNIAVVWLEAGEPVELPECKDIVVGNGNNALSGDVYTWKKLQPGHGIVINLCPELKWMNSK